MRKVALVLSGHMRGYETALRSLTHNLFNQTNYTFDIFISTWSERGFYTGKQYLKPRTDGYIRVDESHKGFVEGNLVNPTHIQLSYNPVYLEVEDFNTVEPLVEYKVKNFTNAYTRPKNTASQFYKINRILNVLWQKSKIDTYEYVIRTRPDLVLQSPMPNLAYFDPNRFYTNLGHNSINKGIGDQLAISGFENMMKYKELFNSLEKLYEKVGFSCPHVFTEEFLKMNHILYEEIPNEALRLTLAHSPYQPYTEHDTGKVWEPQS